MTRYKYEIAHASDYQGSIPSAANALAKDGWRVIQVISTDIGVFRDYGLILERPVEEEDG